MGLHPLRRSERRSDALTSGCCCLPFPLSVLGDKPQALTHITG